MSGACVIFDVGGVLEHTPPTGWQAAWERRLGLPADAVNERLANVWAAGAVGAITDAGVHAVERHLTCSARRGYGAAGA